VAVSDIIFKVPAGRPQQTWIGRIVGVNLVYDPHRLFRPSLFLLESGEGTAETLSGPGVTLEKGRLSVRREATETPVFLFDAACGRVLFSDKEISDISGQARWTDDRLSVTGLEGRFLGAVFTLNAEVFLKAPSFDLRGRLDLRGLDMAELIRAFKLKERLEATGVYSGHLTFAVHSGRIEILDGKMSSETGGRVHLIDASLLEEGASLTKSTANIVVESFKNYYYDEGGIVIGFEGRNVKLDFMLDGPGGSRQIAAVLHGPEEDIRDEKND